MKDDSIIIIDGLKLERRVAKVRPQVHPHSSLSCALDVFDESSSARSGSSPEYDNTFESKQIYQ